MKKFVAAVIQMNSGSDRSSNLATAERLIEQAAEQNAELVALPELFSCLGNPETMVANAESIPGPTSECMGRLAKQFGITLVAGSFAEKTESGKICNTSLLIGTDGEIISSYRKIHLFDIDIPGEVTFNESSFMEHGKSICVYDTSIGRIAQATCYDLRFPELFRIHAEQDAAILVLPAAFTMATGRDHWEVLLRARAIENQMYVLAPNQFGHHGENLQTYGRSMIIDPWGNVLTTAPDTASVITAEIDSELQKKIRRHLPCLQHRRDLDSLVTEKSMPTNR